MKNNNLINISKKSFLSVLIILVSLMVAAFILTYIIPEGAYIRDVDGNIIPDTFTFLSGDNLSVFKLITAPIEIFGTSDGLTVIMICIFLFVLGGFFTVMEKTQGITVIIKKMIVKYKDRKYLLIRLIVLIFMIFGAFFGVFEESVALLPIIILLSLSLGFDTLLALGMTLLAAGFGFASAITNPFSVGIASEIAGINILSGALLRIAIFVIMYFVVSTFLVMYAKKIEKKPEKSLTYQQDLVKTRNFEINSEIKVKNEDKIFKVYTTVFVVLIVVIIGASVLDLAFNISIPTIPLMAATFLIGGLISGYLMTKNIKFILKAFLKGMLTVLPAALLIILAISVKYIISEGNIMDTILHYLETLFVDKSAIVGILGIYMIILFIQFFIGSASAKAFLIMPIIIPLVTLIGISKELAILAFIFGDGYTNVIFPTNGVLLIGLSIANVSYGKWFKWTYKLQLFTLLLTIILLIFAYYIGY
ncbi:MAG: YfcC family protein [Tenericutes bacterium]|nr:YfcC family protein [Mycoplasmatota bacterium]